jgi:hypothetical protein
VVRTAGLPLLSPTLGGTPLAGISLFVFKKKVLRHEIVSSFLLSLLLKRSYAGPTMSSK